MGRRPWCAVSKSAPFPRVYRVGRVQYSTTRQRAGVRAKGGVMRIVRSHLGALAFVVGTFSVAGGPGTTAAPSRDPQATAPRAASARLPFVENHGQLAPEVRFYASTFAGTAFVTDSGLTYAVPAAPGRGPEARPMVALRETFV